LVNSVQSTPSPQAAEFGAAGVPIKQPWAAASVGQAPLAQVPVRQASPSVQVSPIFQTHLPSVALLHTPLLQSVSAVQPPPIAA